MSFRRLTAAVLSSVFLFSGTVFAANEASDSEKEYSGEYQAFERIATYISELYIDESLTKEDAMAQGISTLLEGNDPLLISLLKSTLQSVDDYSEFYTEEEYKKFVEMMNNTFYGIGVTMRQGDDGYVEIIELDEKSGNAQKAGLEIGDKFVKVNGVDVTGWTVAKVRELIVGEEGTTVDITVLRSGEEIDITATRVAINISTVSSGILEGNIGYIQIDSFNAETADDFNQALDLMRDNNVKKIILDLRNNGGGLVSAAVEIAQSIVPKGKIIDVKYRQEQYNMTYTSNLSKKEFDFVVLVNENTASASEILSSAIQDSKAGVLVGTNTFGKAVIQNTYPLSNGSVFKLTTGQYITRNGKEINHKGLTPDKYVENEITKVDTSKYTQFDYKTRTALGDKNDNVLAAKERLAILGYYSGQNNDIYDIGLQEAVKLFQLENDIFAYGILDIPTQEQIENVFSDIDVTDDKQLKTAYELCGGDVTQLYK